MRPTKRVNTRKNTQVMTIGELFDNFFNLGEVMLGCAQNE
jgi:hypothetical protein